MALATKYTRNVQFEEYLEHITGLAPDEILTTRLCDLAAMHLSDFTAHRDENASPAVPGVLGAEAEHCLDAQSEEAIDVDPVSDPVSSAPDDAHSAHDTSIDRIEYDVDALLHASVSTRVPWMHVMHDMVSSPAIFSAQEWACFFDTIEHTNADTREKLKIQSTKRLMAFIRDEREMIQALLPHTTAFEALRNKTACISSLATPR